MVLHKPEDLVALLPLGLPRFKPGDRPLPEWELVELLGKGGFGEVWKARHAHLASLAPVALKFCTDSMAKDILLRHEAAVLDLMTRQGRHPGIVPLLDAHLSSDPPCLKYEYIAGGDLTGLIREWKTLAPAQRVLNANQLMQRLAPIVAYAHRLGPPIVHRDLKPANILAQCPGNGDYRLWVTDFGIGGAVAASTLSAARQGTLTRGARLKTIFLGTHSPLYASPQQVAGKQPDPRDDVHALGVIWWQMLLGDLESGAPTGLDWPEDLKAAGMSEPLIKLLGGCISDRLERRLANAAVLAEQLEQNQVRQGRAAPVRHVPVFHTRSLSCLDPHRSILQQVLACKPRRSRLLLL